MVTFLSCACSSKIILKANCQLTVKLEEASTHKSAKTHVGNVFVTTSLKKSHNNGEGRCSQNAHISLIVIKMAIQLMQITTFSGSRLEFKNIQK